MLKRPKDRWLCRGLKQHTSVCTPTLSLPRNELRSLVRCFKWTKSLVARPFKWSRLNTAFKWYYKFFSILQNKICNFDQFWLQPFLRVEGLSPIHQKVFMKWLIYNKIKFFVNDILRKLKLKKNPGLQPRWSPEFFSGFFTQLHKLRSLRRSFLHFH